MNTQNDTKSRKIGDDVAYVIWVPSKRYIFEPDLKLYNPALPPVKTYMKEYVRCGLINPTTQVREAMRFGSAEEAGDAVAELRRQGFECNGAPVSLFDLNSEVDLGDEHYTCLRAQCKWCYRYVGDELCTHVGEGIIKNRWTWERFYGYSIVTLMALAVLVAILAS